MMATKSKLPPRTTWLGIDPARLRSTITILQQGSGVDVSGATATWTTFGTDWAEIVNLRGTDQWKSGQYTSEKYSQITIRFRDGVVSNMRITYLDTPWDNPGASKTRTFDVQDVVNVDERSLLLQLLCIELDGK